MPGKIIQCLKKTKTENPLILIDEVSNFFLPHLFFCNAVHPVQSPRLTQGRGLQSKGHHYKQGGNATNTQGATKSERDGKDLRKNRKPNHIQKTKDKHLKDQGGMGTSR